jgi:hypothetical protein
MVKIGEINESPFQLERQCRQRRQVNEDRMFTAHPGNILSIDTAKISYVAAAIGFRIGIDNLTTTLLTPRLYGLSAIN